MPKQKIVDMREPMKIERLVRDIFNRRAEGQLQKDIAKALNVKPYVVSNILRRKTHAHVTIAQDVYERVKAKQRKTHTRTSTPPPPSRLSVAVALSDYTVACASFVSSEKAALDAGINQDMLDLLRVAIRESS